MSQTVFNLKDNDELDIFLEHLKENEYLKIMEKSIPNAPGVSSSLYGISLNTLLNELDTFNTATFKNKTLLIVER